ncbi:Uncharacterized protein dnm_021370 [Desulfonema magnum]|uniref:Uncharacterized protein n=1 Tax=Desulfonema magnum TaxID=45655 RepID=A0A975BI35_9BACT|nr:Uncharacterized protein dnm_021370 [Desulfonema magnum]
MRKQGKALTPEEKWMVLNVFRNCEKECGGFRFAPPTLHFHISGYFIFGKIPKRTADDG